MPTLDVESTVAELSEAMGLLLRRMRRVAIPGELSLSAAAVLKTLEKEGPATSADLAREQGMTPQSMGSTIDALRARGLVTRQADPTDGRRVLIELAPQGADLIRANRTARRAWLAEGIERLGAADQEVLADAAAVIKRLCGV